MNSKLQSTILILPSVFVLIVCGINYLSFASSFILSILTFTSIIFLIHFITKAKLIDILKSNIGPIVFVVFTGLMFNSAIKISEDDKNNPVDKIHFLLIFVGAMVLIVSFAFMNTQNIILKGDKKSTKTIKSIDLNEYLIALSAFIVNNENQGIDFKIEYFEKYFRNKKIEVDFEIIKEKINNYHQNTVDLENVCNKILWLLSHKQKSHLIFHLIEIAVKDKNKLDEADESTIKKICHEIGINTKTFNHFKSIFVVEEHDYSGFYDFSTTIETGKEKLQQAYLMLEIQENATDDEVKKAYRRKVKEFHPDKVNYLGFDAVNDAEIMFKQLQEAYFFINQSRK